MTIAETALAISGSSHAKRLFISASSHLTRTLAGPTRSTAIKALALLEGYSKYLDETNDRVSTVKTFANPALPVSLVDHFVTTNLKIGNKRRPIDQDTLIEKALKPSRIVISATAGFGKSMLMKYISLSLYQSPRGKIPIFVELRNLNRVSTPNLTVFINSTYKTNSSVGVEAFRQGLQSGAFVLILDGFDEINHDLRGQVEAQILDLARDYPRTSIIVSGRPDEKFLSWRSFEVYKICPMSKSHVIELINKLEYDTGTKKRFIQKIKAGMYESHESFLSTPLLAILMLLTYEENANIPDKMHLFYSKAFETLFHKHDAMKEQYDRQRKSDLQIDDFEKVFSVFCLASYVQEKLEFSRPELLKLIKSSIEFNHIDVNYDHVLFDIEEAVCLLQKEGTSYFFVHRSFQEYFTAVFLSNAAESIRDDFIEQVAMRHWDSVLPMLFDMASNQIEASWVKRRTDEYLSYVSDHGESPISIIVARWKGIGFYKTGQTHEVYNLIQGSFATYLSTMRRFYSDRINITSNLNFSELRTLLNMKSADEVEIEVKKPGSYKIRNILFENAPLELLKSAGVVDFAHQEYEFIKTFVVLSMLSKLAELSFCKTCSTITISHLRVVSNNGFKYRPV